MSTASAPISIASAISLIRSPACVPTMPPPTIRCVASSNSSFVKPSSRPLAIARPDAAHGKSPLLDLDALRLRLVLGDADPRDLRIGVGDRRNHARVEVRFLAGGRFRGDVAFVRRLVREHRLADDVADREDVRHVGAHLVVDGDEAAIGDRDARLVGADLLAVRRCGRRSSARRRRAAAPSARSRPRTSPRARPASPRPRSSWSSA